MPTPAGVLVALRECVLVEVRFFVAERHRLYHCAEPFGAQLDSVVALLDDDVGITEGGPADCHGCSVAGAQRLDPTGVQSDCRQSRASHIDDQALRSAPSQLVNISVRVGKSAMSSFST
jgi:hypothetical protein